VAAKQRVAVDYQSGANLLVKLSVSNYLDIVLTKLL